MICLELFDYTRSKINTDSTWLERIELMLFDELVWGNTSIAFLVIIPEIEVWGNMSFDSQAIWVFSTLFQPTPIITKKKLVSVYQFF